mmetsp:Transcript_37546/g.74555  ORF Transcript_37546/g.74555 Transcript_37546/m.74555 type:complete len:220 (+) Transcript_37546:129-788(+)
MCIRFCTGSIVLCCALFLGTLYHSGLSGGAKSVAVKISAALQTPEIACSELAKQPGLECCAEAKDCSPYSGKELIAKVRPTWDWLTQGCKTPNEDVCTLWHPCIAEGNLTKGAIQYWSTLNVPMRMIQHWYCKNEMCNNAVFNLESTTLKDADDFCDGRFGNKWRDLQAGFSGMGWVHLGHDHPGSGIWECAHSNYHCDWAYCKIFVCNKTWAEAVWSQ